MLYPGVRDIIVETLQRGEGVPEDGKPLRLSLRDRSLDPRMLLPCANPACRKGGFWLRPRVDAAVRAGERRLDETLRCAGHLGPVRSGNPERSEPPRCPNTLEVHLEIV